MIRIPRSAGPALLAALVAALAWPSAPLAEDELPAPAIVKTRWGTTPRGATRIVFELDHPAKYRTTEGVNGLEVRLLGVRTDPLPSTMPVGSGGVRDVTFRPDPGGVVAHISGPGGRLTARTFTLDGPPRVILDLTLQEDAGVAVRPADPEPPAPAKPAAQPRPPVAPVVPDEPSAANAANDADDVDKSLEELVAWITQLQEHATALKVAPARDEERRRRRSLALLLSVRGLAREALAVLEPALATVPGGSPPERADSLRIAELRLEAGDPDGAAELSRALLAGRPAPDSLVRVARLLQRCGVLELAVEPLQEALPRLTGSARLEARLLLATAAWEKRDLEQARRHAREVAEAEEAPDELRGEALLLEADCAWAQGRIAESEKLYGRALRTSLDDEDACWATLQLGNAARRNGKPDDAAGHYRSARDRWPGTFYGAQAEWFLRVTEQAEPATRAGKAESRG